MPTDAFDLAAYLARIGLAEAPSGDLAGLTMLQWAQLQAIPFENLDISQGRGIDASPAAVFAQLVTARRGGYCHQCNGLLHQALEALGFDSRLIGGRVLLDAVDGGVPARSHTLVLVDLPEGVFLADCGFGAQTPRRPLLLVEGATASRGRMTWQVDRDPRFGWRVSLTEGGQTQALYVFDLSVRHPIDITLANHWSATSPDSIFTQGPLAVRHRADGRLVLFGGKVASRSEAGLESRSIADVEVLLEVLEGDFGLRLDPTAEEKECLASSLDKSRSKSGL